MAKVKLQRLFEIGRGFHGATLRRTGPHPDQANAHRTGKSRYDSTAGACQSPDADFPQPENESPRHFPESFKRGMSDAEAGRFADTDAVLNDTSPPSRRGSK